MKLFVLLSRVPFPLEKGDKLRAYHQVKRLALKHEVHLCCLSDSTIDDEALLHLKSLVKEVYVFKLQKPLIAARLLRAVFSDLPFQVHYFYQSSIQRKINQLLHQIKPDHIYCQLIRCTEYVKNYHDCAKTVDYMDALSAGHRRRIKQSSGIYKLLLGEESKRLVAYENRIFDYFEHHTIISSQDRDLIYHEKRNEIVVIPNGVDSQFFQPTKTVKQFTLLFTGNMNYPPNINGAKYLVEEILPLLKSKGHECSLLIAGANPAQEVQDLGSIENVTVSGWLEDIRWAYANAQIFVAPMFIGSGLQNKLLEAMSMAMPCVTTSLSANAFSKSQKECLLIADTKEGIGDHILQLLKDSVYAEGKGSAGRDLVLNEFGWESTIQLLELTMASSKH